MALPRLDQSQVREMDSRIAELLENIHAKHEELVASVAAKDLLCAAANALFLMDDVAELRHCLRHVAAS